MRHSVRVEGDLPRPVLELATDLYAREYGLSGPQLHRLFGYHTNALGSYPMDDKPSRWVIFQRGMESLGPAARHTVLRELVAQDRRDDPRVDQLKGYLGTGITPASREMLGDLDWDRVRESWDDALKTSGQSPAAAIRAARTTLESVCKHICDERGQSYPSTGDMNDLYRAAQKCLVLSPAGSTDQVAKQLLSGVGTVLNAISAMRNELGDAHGQGLHTPTARPTDARLVVNMAFGIAQFLIDCHRATPAILPSK